MVVNVMQQPNESWIAMFRRIPGNLHETLVLGLRTGAEIVMQRLLKLEPDFMIMRGRVAGTQDSGRIILIPYGELAFVSSTRLLKDTEVEVIFGKATADIAPDLVLAPVQEAGETSQDAPVPELAATEQAPEEKANPPKKPDAISKTVLLAKLRERMREAK